MQTSISTTFDYSVPIEQQLPMIHKAGFTHVSFGMNYEHSGLLDEANWEKLGKLLKENDLLVDTVHGYDLDRADSIEKNEILARAARALGAPVVVIHCTIFWFEDDEYEEKYQLVAGRIKEMERIAKETGIRFAFENMVPGKPTDLCVEMVKMADPEYIGFCYDSSHDQIDGPRPMDLLSELQDRVIAVHLSDRIREFVDHVIPGEGFVRFDEITPLLKASPFKGPILMEVGVENSKYKDPEELVAKAHEAAADLWNKVYS
ncbi:MAG: sugar phosphate isomerase/epimerase [Clostridiales bacterium]|nr:sugar phosphate isomerase/epimerase [Clostridiales bacterium]